MIRDALEGRFGLFPADRFRLARGGTRDDSDDRDDIGAPAAALWHFPGETLALPRAGNVAPPPAAGMRAMDDVARWAASGDDSDHPLLPPLIWIGSPMQARAARLRDDGRVIDFGGAAHPFAVVPRLALNRSYYDETSIDFLAARALSVRGVFDPRGFTARTLWPEDFRLDPSLTSLRIDATPGAVRGLVRAEARGGATTPFSGGVLWERAPGERRWADKPVLAFVLNGAQGDDDEAHGGHLASITGIATADGYIGDWLANNFYTLDSYSEKGIIAGAVPLDAYLADLNSGQAWYRPTYIVAAVMSSARAASRIQSAMGIVFQHLYRHRIAYRHASMNCAGITVDALRTLGWNVPRRGPTSRLAAAGGFPYLLAREASVGKAIQNADYLWEDQTRLFPAAAFEEIAADLLGLASGRPRRMPSAFEAALGDEIEALVYLRMPQLPSSRATGDFPVVTLAEYRRRLPADPAAIRVVPVPPRPFPPSLRDAQAPADPVSPGRRIARAWALLAAAGAGWLLARAWRRRPVHPSGQTELLIPRKDPHRGSCETDDRAA